MPIARASLVAPGREARLMAEPLLPEELWEIIEPLLPKWTPSPKGGQPRIPDRNVLHAAKACAYCLSFSQKKIASNGSGGGGSGGIPSQGRYAARSYLTFIRPRY